MIALDYYILATAAVIIYIILLLNWKPFNMANARLLLRAPVGYTVSGYTWRCEQAGGWWAKLMRPLIDIVARVPNHCELAYLRDVANGAIP